MDKKEIRKEIKKIRTMLSDTQKHSASLLVFGQLEKRKEFIKAEHILFYYSLPDELPTQDFLTKWSSQKQIYLPRVCGEELEILHFDASKLRVGSFNIEEPVGDDCVAPDIIDLIIVPGVAFDKCCNRLGRGKGFYDRLLSCTNAVKIGVCYDFQVLDAIPIDAHDVPMDMIISDKRIIKLA